MEPYLLSGIILPERAQLSLQSNFDFKHISTGNTGSAKVSIILNQLAVWISTQPDWDIFDLRNVALNIVRGELALVGYLKGYAYDVQITRALCEARKVDYVFGIDVPILAKRGEGVDLRAALTTLRGKVSGDNGVFLRRCFDDLVASMKHADDTAFYCYRAIESLRHHCAARNGLTDREKAVQWAKLREESGCSADDLRVIKEAADPLRHGAVEVGETLDRATLFTKTWDVVDAYLKGV